MLRDLLVRVTQPDQDRLTERTAEELQPCWKLPKGVAHRNVERGETGRRRQRPAIGPIRGVEIADPPVDQLRGHRTVYFFDPEGNLLEIYAEI